MFELFTDGARLLMTAAREEAVRRGSPFIGAGHILLALLSDRAFGAVRVLSHLGVDVGGLRDEVGKIAPRGNAPPTTGQVPFTPDAKTFIEAAADMAAKLGHADIATSHFLLADLGDPRGFLPRLMNEAGMDVADIRHKVWVTLAKVDSD